MAEGFKGLWWFWSSPTVHTAISTSSVHLHCSVLVSRSLNKDICLRKALPYLIWSHHPTTSRSFSHCVITNNPCWAPQPSGHWCVRYAHYPPYILSFDSPQGSISGSYLTFTLYLQQKNRAE